MTITIIIFIISILIAFIMLSYRAWEIRTGQIITESNATPVPEIAFRNLEKNVLYLAKRFIQSFVLGVVKYWFLATTKVKKEISENWPKVHKMIEKKAVSSAEKTQSFVKRAVAESKYKIKRLKEKIRQDHDM